MSRGFRLSSFWRLTPLLVCLLAPTATGPESGPESESESEPESGAWLGTLPNDTVARGKKGAVVSAEKHATRIGLEVLRQGGNAVDAAVAVALALAVTHPQAGNLGGGGFMVIRMADGRKAALDFRERAPARATRDMYLRPDGSVDPKKSLYGVTAAGVPGSPAGMVAALERFGTLPLKELVAPAAKLAREGFPVDHFLARSLSAKARVLGRFPSSRAVFFRGDRPLGQGELLIQKDLAGTLERFAEKGREGFYAGETARLLLAQMQKAGGYISAQDLKQYEPKWRTVLRGSYRGHVVLSMPPVSSGGIALIQMLNILEGYDLRQSGFGSSQTIHLLAEAMKRAFADRARWLGDPDYYKVPTAGLIAKDYAHKLRAGIAKDRASAVEAGLPKGAKESDDTTHFSVVDAAGNAVACTTTINSSWGCGLVAEGAGFLLNNEMDDFSAKPGVPNQFGLVGGEANAIGPGKRMLSSMTPTIVLKDGKLRLVLGSPGGGRIINTVLQVLLNVTDHQLPVEEAVRAPRIHHQWKPAQIYYERLSLSADVRQKLEAMGHSMARKPRVIGRCQAIEVLADGTRVAAADPRTTGSAAAY